MDRRTIGAGGARLQGLHLEEEGFENIFRVPENSPVLPNEAELKAIPYCDRERGLLRTVPVTRHDWSIRGSVGGTR